MIIRGEGAMAAPSVCLFPDTFFAGDFCVIFDQVR